jgi:hypothetical protein
LAASSDLERLGPILIHPRFELGQLLVVERLPDLLQPVPRAAILRQVDDAQGSRRRRVDTDVVAASR